jgi:hypothetical protein
MSVTLRKRKNEDGSTTLRLDIYHNGRRAVETLKHLRLSKPSNLLDHEQNKERHIELTPRGQVLGFLRAVIKKIKHHLVLLLMIELRQVQLRIQPLVRRYYLLPGHYLS